MLPCFGAEVLHRVGAIAVAYRVQVGLHCVCDRFLGAVPAGGGTNSHSQKDDEE